MSLILIANTQACTINLTVPFQGFNGTPPYTYSVLPGGAGGVIDPTTGEYTAPDVYGTDIVQVEDSTTAIAQLPISILTYIELLCDILQTQLEMPPGRVWLFDQKINQPKDPNMFIVVQSLSCKPYSNTFSTISSGTELITQQYTNFQNSISIDIMSRGIEAQNRKEEVLQALASYYCESQQEFNSFNISLISHNFVNLSQVDGNAIPYHYNISINIQYAMSISQSVPYYDTFTGPEIITDTTPPTNSFLLWEPGNYLIQDSIAGGKFII